MFDGLIAHESLVGHCVIELRTWIQDVDRLLLRSAIEAALHMLFNLLEKFRFFNAASHYFYESWSVIRNRKWCDGLVIISDNFWVLIFREGQLFTKMARLKLLEFVGREGSLLHDWLPQLIDHSIIWIELVIIGVTGLRLIDLTLGQLFLISLLKKLRSFHPRLVGVKDIL